MITQYKCHHWIFWTISEWILIIREWRVTVHNCARRKRTLIMYASNLPNLPWNIPSMVHKIRITVKRRSNLLACIGKPLLPQSGNIPASSKAAAAAAATAAAILYQPSENEVHLYQERNPSRGQSLDKYFWMTDLQKTFPWYSHLQVRMIWLHGESKMKVYRHPFWQADSWEASYELGEVILPVLRRR